MGNSDNPLSGGWPVSIPESVSSQRDAQIEADLAKVASQIGKGGSGSGASSQVGPCAGGGIEGSNGFIIARTVNKKGEFDTMCFAQVPSSTDHFEVVIGKTSDSHTKSATITKTLTPQPQDVAANHAEVQFPHPLDYGVQYGAIRIKAFDSAGNVVGVFPTTNPWNGTQFSYFDQWTTGSALGAPGTPICPSSGLQVGGDVLTNQVYVDHDGGHAQLKIRAYYDVGRVLTADQQNAVSIGMRLKLVTDGSFIKAHTPVTAGSNTFEDVAFNDLPEGLQVFLHDVWIEHGTGRNFGSVADCGPITCGATNVSASAFATMCAGTTVTFAANPDNANQQKSTVTYPQPTPPFAVKKVQLESSDDNQLTWNIDNGHRPIGDTTNATAPGNQSVSFNVKTKAAKSRLWRAHLLARPGLEGFSPVFTSTGVADATADPAACNAPPNLRASWEAAQVTYKWAVPTISTTGLAALSVQSYNVWITSGGSFMQVLSDGTTPAGKLAPVQSKAGSQFLMTSRHFTVKLKVKALDPAFVGGWTINVSANNMVGGVLTEGTAASLSLAPGVDYLNATDAVNVLDVSTTVYSPGQIVRNGDFLYARNSSINTAKAWFSSVNGSSLPSSGAISWQIGSDNVLFTTGSGQFAQNLAERLSPGDIFAISFLARSSTNQTVTFNPSFIDGGTGGGSTTQVPSISAALTTSYSLFGAVMQLSSSAISANPQWFNLSLNNGLGGQTVEVDRVMLVRGKQPSAFTPRVEQYETNNTGTSENPDINATPQPTGSQDIGNPTQGGQGNWVLPGSGGRIGLS